jgi:transposase
MRKAPPVVLSKDDRKALKTWANGRATPARLVQRAKIILAAADGLENKAIAEKLKTTNAAVGRWRNRFVKGGLAAIEKDKPGRGRPAKKREENTEKIIQTAVQSKPENATHWSNRMLAEKLGLDKTMVNNVLREADIKPHLTRTFKVSNDKFFREKLIDVVGVYLSPPANAIVFCADEKSQVQALDRTQPGLPMKKGRAGTMTHDYKRNGTTTLFAAMNVADGSIIADCKTRHRHIEWLAFLKKIDTETPKGLDIHVILDNYSTHKHEKVKAWLKKNPRFHMHFIPTSSSWLNLVERFFRELTDRMIRRGVFLSVQQLIEKIMRYIAKRNEAPTPFVWTAKISDILQKVERARAAIPK